MSRSYRVHSPPRLFLVHFRRGIPSFRAPLDRGAWFAETLNSVAGNLVEALLDFQQFPVSEKWTTAWSNNQGTPADLLKKAVPAMANSLQELLPALAIQPAHRRDPMRPGVGKVVSHTFQALLVPADQATTLLLKEVARSAHWKLSVTQSPSA